MRTPGPTWFVLLAGLACQTPHAPDDGVTEATSRPPVQETPASEPRNLDGSWTRDEGSLFHPIARHLRFEGERFVYEHRDATLGPRSVGGDGWLELVPAGPSHLPPAFPARLWVLTWGDQTLLAEDTDLGAVCNLYNTDGRSAHRSQHPYFTRGGLPAAGARPLVPVEQRAWLHDEALWATLLESQDTTNCDQTEARTHYHARIDQGRRAGVFTRMRLYLGGGGHEFIVSSVEEDSAAGFFCTREPFDPDYVPPAPGARLATKRGLGPR